MWDYERTLSIPNSHYNLFGGGGGRLSEAFVDEHSDVARSLICRKYLKPCSCRP